MLENFQNQLFPYAKRKELQYKAFSCIAARLQKSGVLSFRPSMSLLKTAALLAWEGHLTSVKRMDIRDKSIRDIPRDQMEKLASIVTGEVYIFNMTHHDQLGSILASVKCTQLGLVRMDLSDTETRALVTAMRDRLETVVLSGVTLDMEELAKYNGQGHCSWLELWDDNMMLRYGERLREWAADQGWTVTEMDGILRMERNSLASCIIM